MLELAGELALEAEDADALEALFPREEPGVGGAAGHEFRVGEVGGGSSLRKRHGLFFFSAAFVRSCEGFTGCLGL